MARGIETFAEAALLGEGWEQALEALAADADASGAAIARTNGDGRSEAIIASRSIVDSVSTYLAAARPPDPREARVHATITGFLADYDSFAPEELAKDPFYQEFLRPVGYQWHAVSKLHEAPDGEVVLSFKRRIESGHYDRAGLDRLDAALPHLQRIAAFAAGQLELGARNAMQVAELAGRRAYLLDQAGCVIDMTAAAADLQDDALHVKNRRLASRDTATQRLLDAAVAIAAAARPPAPSFAPIWRRGRGSAVVRLMPIAGAARDIFASASAIAILFEQRRPSDYRPRHFSAAADCFGLTPMERRVTVAIMNGRTLKEIAHDLDITLGTCRNHLKSVLRKTSCQRQTDLAVWLTALTE